MKAIIQWFVKNPVASNLLMLFILFGGYIGLNTTGKTVMPSAAIDLIQISVPYLGGNPYDVEARVLIPVEEAVSGLKGIKRIRSNAFEGNGQITIEVVEGHDVEVLLNEVKARVDAINTFPSQSERPVVRRQYVQQQAMFIMLSGDIEERELKELGRNIRDRIAAIRGAEKTNLQWDRAYQISVELSEFQLQKYGLTFSDVAQAIRRSSLNMGAGMIDDPGGQTQLITRGQAYVEDDFENMVVATQDDGNQLLLRDVAEIIDGFDDSSEVITRYNNMPTLLLTVISDADPDIVALSREVHRLLEEEIRPTLPEGVQVDVLIDNADVFKDRLQLLLDNGLSGLFLVFLGLTLFLTPRLAAWVVVGICISFMGCFWLMPYFDVSLTMVSTFALVLILGIVVDDAVIIGESIHRKNEQGLLGAEGAIAGAEMVAKPVIFSALTTMLAFSPLLFILGSTRSFIFAIPMVVISTLVFSLLESFCILPNHLVTHQLPDPEQKRNFALALLDRIRKAADNGLRFVIQRVYRPFLDKVLHHRMVFLSSFFAVCFVILSFSIGGWIKFSFMPNVVADFIQVNMAFPAGIPLSVKEDALNKLESSAGELQAQLKQEYPDKEIIKGAVFWTYTGATEVGAYLTIEPAQSRLIGPEEIARRWREMLPTIPDAKEMNFQFTINESNPGLYLVVAGDDLDAIAMAVGDLKDKLNTYQGIYEVVDSTESTSSEAVLSLLPAAESFNISLSDLATQVRQAYYGEEVQRIPRGKDTVKVMVRLPEEDRKSFASLNDLRIRTADGRSVPFDQVAKVEYRPGVSRLSRTDRNRNLWVTAMVDEQQGSAEEIHHDMDENYLPQLRKTYSGLNIYWAGSQEEENEFMSSLANNSLFALFAIFFLLAVAFRSYSQPLLIMTAIPCGFIGALLGHLLLGLDLSMYSILGIVAAAGVVINDNLVLLDYINRLRDQGLSAIKAVEQAAEARFRPIFLTSFTTFIGLIPMMLEKSVQAQFMIPTVVSLAFGVLFATTVTLLLIPVLYLLLLDSQRGLKRLYQRIRPASEENEPMLTK